MNDIEAKKLNKCSWKKIGKIVVVVRRYNGLRILRYFQAKIYKPNTPTTLILNGSTKRFFFFKRTQKCRVPTVPRNSNRCRRRMIIHSNQFRRHHAFRAKGIFVINIITETLSSPPCRAPSIFLPQRFMARVRTGTSVHRGIDECPNNKCA